MGSFGRLWRVLLALQSFVRVWEAFSGGLERFGKGLGVLRGFCEALATIVKIGKPWMVWKALEVLAMLSEPLGSVDVNTLCPLAGSLVADCV